MPNHVSIRDPRNSGGDIERVGRGEELVVTRSGKPVAELRPLHHRLVSLAKIKDRWARLPKVDPVALRRDIDAIIEQDV
jgi:antitoxin (DNA-binding transcriptional repressor) of toxin-antitoxin stability system